MLSDIAKNISNFENGDMCLCKYKEHFSYFILYPKNGMKFNIDKSKKQDQATVNDLLCGHY